MAARALSFVLYYSGGLWVFERLNRRAGPQCLVVNYHRIVSESLGYHDIAVNPASFRRQLDFMRARGYRFLSLGQYEAYLEGRFQLEGDSILLTFDDGYRDNYLEAFPVLQEFGIPATVFLCTGSIETDTLLWWDRVVRVVRALRREGTASIEPSLDIPQHAAEMLDQGLRDSDAHGSIVIANLIDWLKSRPATEREEALSAMERMVPVLADEGLMLTWDMVREMYAAGIAFGAHSVTHPVFSEISPEAATREITESKHSIESQLGGEVTAFAYPYGKHGYFDGSTVDALRSAGIKWAFTTENGVNTPQSDCYTLLRDGLRDVPKYLLAVRLAGVFEHPAFAKLRSLIEGRRQDPQDAQNQA
jgi:peptidoglycan/xylan/chitin deacetylase (PgdA/CDA1 family)